MNIAFYDKQFYLPLEKGGIIGNSFLLMSSHEIRFMKTHFHKPIKILYFLRAGRLKNVYNNFKIFSIFKNSSSAF